jgi:TolB-like protein/Flp pilus assembly protein TadD
MRYQFEDYTLDTDRRELRRGAEQRVPLEPKVFDLLAYLIGNHERVVSRDDMIAAVWDGRIVSESTLATCINGVRSAIGDDGEHQRLIKTLPRKGIRFVGAVRSEAAEANNRPSAVTARFPTKPSVAVMPFRAMTDDPDLEGLTDGLTEEVITGLSRIKGIWVIARNTMFTYKGRTIDVRAVAKELSVSYVLEGSLRRADGRLRMTAQLTEADSGHHIWTAKIDRPSAGPFELQDDLAQCVVASVQTQLIVSEGKAATRGLKPSRDVEDLLARARERLYQPTAEGLAEQIALAEQALLLDPANGEACRLIATGIWHQAYIGFIAWDRAAADRVMKFAQRAVLAEQADEYAHWMLGLAHLMAGQHERAIVSLRRALEINPSCSLAYGSSGTVLAWSGDCEQSIANNEFALRINPGDPTNYHRFFGLALAHYLASRYAKSLEYAESTVQMRPDWWLAHMIHVAALAQSGRVTDARAACRELMRAKSDMTIALLDDLPFAKAANRDLLAEGLRKAGLGKN